MRERTRLRAELDGIVNRMGESDFMEEICSRVAEGDDPRQIAKNMGLTWFVLKEWLKDGDGEKWKRVEFAKGCFADGLVWESLSAARDADSETVAVARLQADHFSKMAGRLSRDEWGDKQQVEIKTTHTVDIRGLLEAREARLMGIGSPDTTLAQSAAHLPVTVVQADYADGVI